MSLFEFYKLLDNNLDGFVTIDEWKSRLDQVQKYSEEIKDGLFAFIDKDKIGMIDYKTFLKTLKYATQIGEIVFDDEKEKEEDEWAWGQKQLQLMKEWFQRESISVEDAFRVIDHDFDGFIKKNDIDHFIKNVL